MVEFTKWDTIIRNNAIPLLSGIVAGLIYANAAPHSYEYIFGTDSDSNHWKIIPNFKLFNYYEITLAFVINDIFMVFFFGLAAKGITDALLIGGAMHPIKRAIAPLVSTIGGIVTPIIVYFILTLCIFYGGGFNDKYSFSTLINGWGIPTATDISLAWVVGNFIFGDGIDGNNHPCISFLLLLAIADDAIGLIIIAIFYSDPNSSVKPVWILLPIAAMIIAYVCRRFIGIKQWYFYVFIVAPISWIGLLLSKIHPALALVPIIPFLSVTTRQQRQLQSSDNDNTSPIIDKSSLDGYEAATEKWVTYGLFFFTFANAGVEIANVGYLTLIIFCAIIVGKIVGITVTAYVISSKHCCCAVPLPHGINGNRHLLQLGIVGSMSLTVALFVSTVAFKEKELRSQCKLGALCAGIIVMSVCLIYSFMYGPRSSSHHSDIANKKDHDDDNSTRNDDLKSIELQGLV